MSQDRELDTYLQGKTDLSRLYADSPQVEPPEHLDAAILAEAHRAVNARPGARPKRRWAIPLGLVASLFAVVMIGLQLPYLLKEAAPLQAPAEEKVAAGAAEPAPAARFNESRKIQSMDKARSEIANQPAPQKAEAYVQPAAPVVAAPMAAMPAPAMSAKRAEMRERAAVANTGALLQEKKSADVGGSSISDALNQRAPAAAGLAASLSTQPEHELKKDGAGKASLPPEDWLTRIRKLKQEGKLEEVRKELQAFRKRYPDYPVPAGIADK